MPKKYWIVVRNRHELPAPNRKKFKRHYSLASAFVEATRLCQLPELPYPAPSFRILECVGELKKCRSGVVHEGAKATNQIAIEQQ